MRTLGRGLQIVGLVALPAAGVLECSGALDRSHGVSQMVIMMVFGFAAFCVGRIVEGYASR
jgi:hypothetical protein